MRWFWIDRYVEFEAGVHATAIKAVTLAEEHLHDHFPGFPVMPNSLILEGLAQTGGLLGFATARFHAERRPGQSESAPSSICRPCRATRSATEPRSKTSSEEAASVSLTSHIGEQLQAEAEVFFAYVDDIADGQQLFPREEFLAWLRMLRLFDVGRYPDGRPLTSRLRSHPAPPRR